jgi:hypothetical protein
MTLALAARLRSLDVTPNTDTDHDKRSAAQLGYISDAFEYSTLGVNCLT